MARLAGPPLPRDRSLTYADVEEDSNQLSRKGDPGRRFYRN